MDAHLLADSNLDSGEGDQIDDNKLNPQKQVQDTDSQSIHKEGDVDSSVKSKQTDVDNSVKQKLNTNVLNSGDIEIRRSTRDRKPTDKMAEYMEEEANKRERKLLQVYERWKTHVRECKSKLKSNSDIESIGTVLDYIKHSESEILNCFDHLRSVCLPSQSIVRKVDACVSITLDILRIANDQIAGLDDLDVERLRGLKVMDHTKSIFGSSVSEPDLGVQKAELHHGEFDLHRPDESIASSSHSSHAKERLIDAAADLADKEADLKSLERKVEVARQRKEAFKELVDVETEYNFPVKRAPLSIKQEPCSTGIKPSDTNFQQKPYQVKTANLQQLNANAPSFMPSFNHNLDSSSNPQHLAQHNATYSGLNKFSNPLHDQRAETYNQSPNFDSLAKALSESVNLNRLPIPEPSIFTGDPLRYTEWKTSFEILITCKGVPPHERIFHLKKYVGDPVRRALEGFFYSGSMTAYESARKLMDERYGHPFIIQKAFRDKLQNWPKIPPRDPIALRDYADFLRSCIDATPHIPGLNILNDCVENQKLISKLPDWASGRWNREVSLKMESSSSYPSFRQFVDFVTKEANIANNPISSPFALNATDFKVKDTHGRGGIKSRALSTNVSANTITDKKCDFCEKDGHAIYKCKVFVSLSIQQKRDFIRKKQLCFGCLRKGHRNNECERKHTCGVCKRKHPTCMHEDRPPNTPSVEVTNDKPVNFMSTGNTDPKTVSSLRVSHNEPQGTSMIVPVWISTQGNPVCEVLTYALLDTQSDTTFILDETAVALNAKLEPVRLSLSTMTSQHTIIDSNKINDLVVRGFNSKDSISINVAYTRNFIPSDKSHIPVSNTVKDWDHLKPLEGELPPLQSCEVGLLIGYNCPQALAPCKILMGKVNEPYGIQTILGWSIVGYLSQDCERSVVRVSHRAAVKVLPSCCPHDVIKVLESDFAHDNINDSKVSQNDIRFLDYMSKHIRQTENNHLEMPLPFKERPVLPDNKALALLRLGHLKRKFKKDMVYHERYTNFMNEMLRKAEAEEVINEGLIGNHWYIPHHGIYHPRKPDKLRVVFDCSASYKDSSLNQHLLTGPDLTNCLAGVLCRFRRHPIALTCDIEKMFHQFLVAEPDRDFLRFLWWENGNFDSETKIYRMRVHLFGAVSSPGCANFGLKYLARLNEGTHPLASSFIQRNFYVDDGLASVETVEEAVKLITGAQELCANGGLRLHKFMSNSKEVLNSIPQSELASNVKDMDLTLEPLPVEQVLGIKWFLEDDVFYFQNMTPNVEPTRRNILSVVASIFDPLGFLSPLTLIGKRVLQEMCRAGTGWNDPLPAETTPQWQGWINDLQNLDLIKIPRCLKPHSFGEPSVIELHHFSDASNKGYGQCSYIRLVNDSGVQCSLLMGKARVTPLKVVSIPRLELTAAVLSVKVSQFLQNELDMPIKKEVFWTDSRVVLGYVKNEARRFHTFVANRVQFIRDRTEPSQWCYIDTNSNPADHASRGLSVKEILGSTWLHGPSFLWECEIGIYDDQVDTELLGDPEVRTLTLHTLKPSVYPSFLDRLTRFSNWIMAVYVTARLIRLSNGVKGTGPPSVEERQKAELAIVSMVQLDVFKDTIRILEKNTSLPSTNPLYPLDPILQDKLLRIGGRLRKAKLPFIIKHPIILPRDSHVTRLVIACAHHEARHQGRGITLNKLRSLGYWIIGGSRTVANYIRQCVTCRKLRRPTESQKMADLPHERIEPSPPFTYCGMDCFGPFIVKNGRKEIKRYGLLFTCMCSRAIHIEMLDNMSTDCFINGLRCFIAIRGSVRQIRSDQGSNFLGAKNEFERLQYFLTEKHCDFILNAPDASHTGGVWERQIRTVRNILNAVIEMCPGRLDDSSLRTLFYEVMSIVNLCQLAK